MGTVARRLGDPMSDATATVSLEDEIPRRHGAKWRAAFHVRRLEQKAGRAQTPDGYEAVRADMVEANDELSALVFSHAAPAEIARAAGRVARLARNLDSADQIPNARQEAERAEAAWREVAPT